MDILVPAWFHGLPVVVDREPAFTAERAVWLMREFGVTLTLLPATALRMIRASGIDGRRVRVPRGAAPAARPLGADLLKWSEEFFGATVNEGYGQTELNACIGNCASVYPVRPGSLGKALPGTTAVVLDDDGKPVIDTVGELALDRRTPLDDAGVLAQPGGDGGEVPRQLAAHRRPGPPGRGRLRLVRVPQGRRHQLGRLPDRPRRDRAEPRRARGRRDGRGRRRAGRAARAGPQGVRRAAPRRHRVRGARRRAAHPRPVAAGRPRGATGDRVPGRAAPHHHRQDLRRALRED